MGNLPEVRITPARAFLKTGVDYAGPIKIRMAKGRGNKSYKGYLAIFVCMVTKAVHIEVVSDYTAKGFIAAYKRFSSRRGLSSDIYSDNGTNFIGANNELKSDHTKSMQIYNLEIFEHLREKGTRWHFIPPFSPNFGGLWEAAVKSAKSHLIKVIGETTLTFEELSTVMSEIEACLNSRPLIAMTSDPSDTTFLTPGHFLIGEPLLSLPEPDLRDAKIVGLPRWKLIVKIKQDFWDKWSKDYVMQLQQRRKWVISNKEIKIGDLVLIKEDSPPSTWLTGRVIETHPGNDSITRVVSLKIRGPGKTILKRPVSKLAIIPVENDEIDDTKEYKDKPSMSITKNAFLAVKDATKLIKSSSSKKYTSIQIVEENVKTEKIRHKSFCSLANLVLYTTLVLCFVNPILSQYSVNKLPSSTGIFFENLGDMSLIAMKWKLVVYYNLTTYHNEIINANKYVQLINNSCLLIHPSKDKMKVCDVIVHQFEFDLNQIKERDKLISYHNKEVVRKKRGLGDTIGNILGDMFGLMSQKEASKYEEDFEKITKNDNHILKLIKNQTSIIDATLNIINQNNNKHNEHFKFFEEHIHYLDTKMSELGRDKFLYDRSQNIIMFSLFTNLRLQQLHEIQERIIDVLINSKHGQFTHHYYNQINF